MLGPHFCRVLIFVRSSFLSGPHFCEVLIFVDPTAVPCPLFLVEADVGNERPAANQPQPANHIL